MLVMMVYLALFPYLGSGPLWPKNGTEKNYCKDTWWYNILYINNLIKVGDQVRQLVNKQYKTQLNQHVHNVHIFLMKTVSILN